MNKVMLALYRTRHVLTLCGILLFAHTANETAYAKLCPGRSLSVAAFNAESAIIVRLSTGDFFEVEETFLGNNQVGDIIHLPEFRLWTCQWLGPDVVEPITPDTRILLFLTRKDDAWDAGYDFFWVQSPDKVDELREKASHALALRKSWKEAVEIADPQERVKALWPYLWSEDLACFDRTKRELQKLGSIFGDFVATQFPSLTKVQRSLLLREAGLWGSERLHQEIIKHLTDQLNPSGQPATEPTLAATFDTNFKVWLNGPSITPDRELSNGLSALVSFGDERDLPLIRQLLSWAAEQKFTETCGIALKVFHDNPDKANLPVIGCLLDQFGITRGVGFASDDYIWVLWLHRYPEAVPLVVKLLSDPLVKGSAHDLLTEIVGTDLGTDPQAWLKWHSKRK